MINEEDGSPNTAHTTNDVPLILVEPTPMHQNKKWEIGRLSPNHIKHHGDKSPS